MIESYVVKLLNELDHFDEITMFSFSKGKTNQVVRKIEPSIILLFTIIYNYIVFLVVLRITKVQNFISYEKER